MPFVPSTRRQRPRSGLLLGAIAAGCGALPFAVTGCDNLPAVRSNTVFAEDPVDPRQALSDNDMVAVKRAMADAAPPGLALVQPVEPPWPRWSDAPIAMAAACSALDMTVVRQTVADGEMVFRLKTLNNRPGEMTLQRQPDAPGYRLEGWIGRFGDPELVSDLSKRFDEQMELLRTRPALEDFRPATDR